MRRVVTIAFTIMILMGIMALPAYAPAEKFTFEDVQLPDGQTGEIEANTKSMKNKDDSVYCGYFTDDYGESLGYYFAPVNAAPLGPEIVLEYCLDNFDDRFEA